MAIAGSGVWGSSDSARGLFDTDLTIQVPFWFYEGSKDLGYFNLAILSHLEWFPTEGPLIKRGWVS